MKFRLRILIGALALGAASAQAVFPIYAERQLKYPRFTTWDDRLPNVWSGWKGRFLINGMVQGRTPTSPTAAVVSEGQSYGMMLALWMGDQTTFNQVWSATESNFWTGTWYRWINSDNNFAGDADIDICGALIFASAMVDAKIWPDYTEPKSGLDYKAKAKVVLKSIIANFIDVGANYRINSWPGAGDGIRNPSYHMPGWYPIFSEFGAANGVTGMDWTAAAKGSFDLIEAQSGSQYGMARNFSTGTGGYPGGGTSSPNNYDMGFDAIRVPYRMALAALWYPSQFPRAVIWCNNVWKNGKVDPTMPGEYQISNASLIGWTTNGYERFMTRGMWGSAAVAVQNQNAQSLAAAQQIGADFTKSVNGNNYLTSDQNDTTLATSPQRNYYAQSLGMLGALVISGRAWNVWDDLKHTWVVPDTSAQITTPLTATPSTIDFWVSGSPLVTSDTTVVTATLSQARSWKVNFKGQTSGAVYTALGNSTAIKVAWVSGKVTTGTSAKFTTEKVDVRLVYDGVDTVTKTSAKANVTVRASSGLEPRTLRGEGTVRWAQGGILLLDPAWHAGDIVRAQVLEINGRTIASSPTSSLRQESKGLLLGLSATHSVGVRVLELTDLSTRIQRRYVLSPNP